MVQIGRSWSATFGMMEAGEGGKLTEGWGEAMCRGRTRRCREGIKSGQLSSKCGIPQGSLLSPILYIFYNVDIFAMCQSKHSDSIGWIDDTNIWVWGKTIESACAHANSLMPRLARWSTVHASEFEPAKLFITLFSLRRNLPPMPPIFLNGVPIPAASSLVILGATLDSKLTFKSHVASVVAKGSTAVGGLAQLSKGTRGLSQRYVRTLVESCVYSKTDYVSSIWFKPGKTVGLVSTLDTVQRATTKMVTGGF
jgi:hypothetical protein